jgi:geranylgeranyl reductase family protein
VSVDAVVVGGGPGGSTAAWRLARGGARVLVLDAATFPRVKLCAGWVTRTVLRDLELDAATYPHTIQPFAAASLAVGERDHETRWASPVSYGIVRAEFDAFLLGRAEDAGAQVRTGVRVRGVDVRADGVTVDTDAGPVTASMIVGAGGSSCPVARTLGAAAGDEAVVVTQESETRIGAERLHALTPRFGTPELIVEPDVQGYGWYFTKGDFLNVGVGAVGGLPVKARLERMLERLRRSGRLPAELALTAFRGHAYAVRRARPRRVAGDRWCLVGDAGGLARDFSGEGIGPAVHSALLAADAILAGRPAEHATRVDAEFGRPEGLLGRLTRHLPDRIVLGAARLACTRPALRRRLVFEGAFGMG